MNDIDKFDVSLESATSGQTGDINQCQLPHLRTKSRKKKVKKSVLVANLTQCKYVVVKQVVRGLKMSVSRDGQGDWDLTWTDCAVNAQTLSRMKPYQKINHFPGMFHLSRKNYLARNLIKMRKKYQQQYDFHPKTWALPAQYNELKTFLQYQNNPVVIAKPEAGCQGRGIFLSKNIEDFNYGEHYVVQKYVKKPFLIQGLKFDLRVYVLVAGCDPLRLYIYKQGLARFATQQYCIPKRQNLHNLFMHLTNYAINKSSSKFQFNQSCQRMDIGHKRSLTSVLNKLQEMGKNSSQIWNSICQIIVKTIISVQPVLAHTYRSCQPDNLANNMCFQLLGFDVMLDSQLKPIILQVNYTPSFCTDTPLDLMIKENLVRDTLMLMHITNKAKNDALQTKKKEIIQRTLTGKKAARSKEERQEEVRRLAQKRDRWQMRHLGNFEPIYPPPNQNYKLQQKYSELLTHSQNCYLKNTGGSKHLFNKDIKRQTKVIVAPITNNTSEVTEQTIPQKYTKTDQLQRIYMKKPKPMIAIKNRQNKSQVKEDKDNEICKEEIGQSRGSNMNRPLKEFVRKKVQHQSIDKFGIWKNEVPRAKTSQKNRLQQQTENRVGTGKPARSVLSRVYNVGFREMKASH